MVISLVEAVDRMAIRRGFMDIGGSRAGIFDPIEAGQPLSHIRALAQIVNESARTFP
jgi:hypothetical protein